MLDAQRSTQNLVRQNFIIPHYTEGSQLLATPPVSYMRHEDWPKSWGSNPLQPCDFRSLKALQTLPSFSNHNQAAVLGVEHVHHIEDGFCEARSELFENKAPRHHAICPFPSKTWRSPRGLPTLSLDNAVTLHLILTDIPNIAYYLKFYAIVCMLFEL